MTELQKLLRFSLEGIGAADLQELTEAAVAGNPQISPAEVHDALNDLIQDGTIALSRNGVYLAQSLCPATP